MELGGKSKATILSTIPSETLDHHHRDIADPQTMLKGEPYQDPEPESDAYQHPDSISPPSPLSPPAISVVNRANQRVHTRGEHPERYMECQKNHAAATGGHVVDGCCEFMSGCREDTPDALKCAACGCHRSFHRKEIEGQDLQAPYMNAYTGSKHLITHPAAWYCNRPYKLLQSHAVQRRDGIIGRRSSSSENMMNNGAFPWNHDTKTRGYEKGLRKKRIRTKISEEQKEKMKEFAEKLGWRMQKQYDVEVEKFCEQVKLRRQVFKVWMHNNRQAMKKNKASHE